MDEIKSLVDSQAHDNCPFPGYLLFMLSEDMYVSVYRCCVRKMHIDRPLIRLSIDDFRNMDLFYLASIIKDNESNYPSVAHKHDVACGTSKVCQNVSPLIGAQVNFLNQCNIRCSFCSEISLLPFEKRKNVALHKELFFETLYKLKGSRLRLRLTDCGEPLLYLSEIKTFLKSLKSAQDFVRIDMTTNGTLIDDEFCQIVEDTRKKGIDIQIVVSVNGASKETRKKLMGVSDFDRVANYVRKLNAGASMVVVDENKHEVDLFKEMFPRHVFLTPR